MTQKVFSRAVLALSFVRMLGLLTPWAHGKLSIGNLNPIRNSALFNRKGVFEMKVSNFIKASIGILVSSTALAGYSEIPQSQLEAYKTAVLLAGRNNDLFNCTLSGSLSHRILGEYISEAQTGKVDLSGAQPILVFESFKQDRSKHAATVVSSPDYKKVVAFKTEEFVWGEINIGDLLHPQIIKGYVLIGSGECK